MKNDLIFHNLASTFNSYSKDLQEELNKELYKSAVIIEKDLKNKTPVRTGEAKRSWVIENKGGRYGYRIYNKSQTKDKIPKTLLFEGAIQMSNYAYIFKTVDGLTPRLYLDINNNLKKWNNKKYTIKEGGK